MQKPASSNNGRNLPETTDRCNDTWAQVGQAGPIQFCTRAQFYHTPTSILVPGEKACAQRRDWHKRTKHSSY